MALLFATASLLAVTVAASFIYYRRIKQAQGEYEGAKDLVKSITLGFTKQLSKITKSVKQIEEEAVESKQVSKEALKISTEALDTAREGLKGSKNLEERIKETEKTMESIKTDIQKLAESYRAPATKIDMETPIPLKQDAVLEQLTPTEIEVLAIIEELGEGSVPEIRERIKKTREHTARMLKKLYEKGFIDRNTSSMPYRYYIRKEIKELIQKQKKPKIAV